MEPERAAEEATTDGFSLGRIGRSAAILASAAAIGQLAVIGRELFVAANEGTSVALDALLVALVLPVVVTGFVFSGVQAALVPAYVDAERRGGRAEAQRFVSGILGWTMVMAVLAVGFTLLIARPAVQIVGPGLTPAAWELSARFLPMLIPLVVLTPLGTIMAGLCQAHGRFGAIAASMVAGSVTSTITTIALWDTLGLSALALAYGANATAVLVVLAGSLGIRGLLPRPSLRLDRARTAEFVRHLAPLTAGSAVLQLNLIADRAVASLVGIGGVSALRYGDQLVQAPLNAVSAGWGTVIYPALVATTRGAERATGEAVVRSLRVVAGAFIPITALIAALAPLVVSVAYERGAFDRLAAERTAGVLAALAPLIPLLMANSVLVSAHNARRRGALIGAAAVTSAILNVTLNLALAPFLGVAGVALSTSVTSAILVCGLSWRLAIAEPGFEARPVVSVLARAVIASTVAMTPIAIIAWSGVLLGSPLVIAVAWLVGLTIWGGIVYLAMSSVLGVHEPLQVIAVVARAIRGRRAGSRR